jgi:ribose 5-phosphate isomerase A
MTRELSPAERAKFVAARQALSYVEPGMRIGLGTGSTAAWFLRLLAERVKAERLDVIGVPTSLQTGGMAERLGLKLTTLDEAGWLDLTVDGADEIDPALNLIKGGGGALLQEKIVATASDRMVVIADESKQVAALGAFPLPVEIVPFGWETTKAIVEETLESCDVGGRKATLRMNRDEPFITDEGHFIIDLHLLHIGKPRELSVLLNQVPGVVDTGLFLGIADVALIGTALGEVKVIDLDAGESVFAAAGTDDEDNMFRRPDE